MRIAHVMHHLFICHNWNRPHKMNNFIFWIFRKIYLFLFRSERNLGIRPTQKFLLSNKMINQLKLKAFIIQIFEIMNDVQKWLRRIHWRIKSNPAFSHIKPITSIHSNKDAQFDEMYHDFVIGCYVLIVDLLSLVSHPMLKKSIKSAKINLKPWRNAKYHSMEKVGVFQLWQNVVH